MSLILSYYFIFSNNFIAKTTRENKINNRPKKLTDIRVKVWEHAKCSTCIHYKCRKKSLITCPAGPYTTLLRSKCYSGLAS